MKALLVLALVAGCAAVECRDGEMEVVTPDRSYCVPMESEPDLPPPEPMWGA